MTVILYDRHTVTKWLEISKIDSGPGDTIRLYRLGTRGNKNIEQVVFNGEYAKLEVL